MRIKKTLPCLIAATAFGIAPAAPVDAQTNPNAETPEPVHLLSDLFCLDSHMKLFLVNGVNCPVPETFHKEWAITCNPLCHPTADKVEMTTSGACLLVTLGVISSWIHCPGAPPRQLIYLGNEFRARGYNAVVRYLGLYCQQFPSHLVYSCSNCEDDICTSLEDPVIVSLEDDHYELTNTRMECGST